MALEISTDFAVQVALAIALLLGTYIVGLIAARILKTAFSKAGLCETDVLVGTTVSKYFVWLLGLFIVLSYLNIEVTPYLVGLVATVLLVIGIVARNPLENVASWYLLRNWGPFEIGDYVYVEGVAGIVRNLDLFQMTIETPDQKYHFIPNIQLVNRSSYRLQREENDYPVEIEVALKYSTDIETVKLFLVDAVGRYPQLSFNKPIKATIDTMSPRCIGLRLRFWVSAFENINRAKDYVSTQILSDQKEIGLYQLNQTDLTDDHRESKQIIEKPQREAANLPECTACGSSNWKGYQKCSYCGSYFVFGKCANCDQLRFEECPIDGHPLGLSLEKEAKEEKDA